MDTNANARRGTLQRAPILLAAERTSKEFVADFGFRGLDHAEISLAAAHKFSNGPFYPVTCVSKTAAAGPFHAQGMDGIGEQDAIAGFHSKQGMGCPGPRNRSVARVCHHIVQSQMPVVGSVGLQAGGAIQHERKGEALGAQCGGGCANGVRLPSHSPEIAMVRNLRNSTSDGDGALSDRRQTLVPAASITGVKGHGSSSGFHGRQGDLQEFVA